MTKVNVNQIRNLPTGGGGSGGITSLQHESLRQLIHLADGVGGPFEGFLNGAYREQNSTIIPNIITWYVDETKDKKIVEKVITYEDNLLPLSIQWSVYDLDGILSIATVTDTITYSGMFELSRTRAINVTSGGSDLVTETTHKMLHQLVHLADGVGGPFGGFTSGAYREITPFGSPFPTSIIWYVNSTKIKKMVQKDITYIDNIFPYTVAWSVYGTDGITKIVTFTDTISFNGIFEQSRVRTFI